MSKKVTFGVKPEPVRSDAAKVDEWVNIRDQDAMKRLTMALWEFPVFIRH
ncbi:MAG: hypothetical protein ACOYMW_16520 [Candidatus Competibacteraceae bacterium]